MIFKTVEDEGNTFIQNLKATFSTGLGSISNLFQKQQFSLGDSFSTTLTKDIEALTNYQNAIDDGIPSYEAYQQTMLTASAAAKELTKNGEAATVMTGKFEEQQTLAQVKTVAQNKSLSNCNSIINEYNSALKSSDKLTATAGVSQENFVTAVGASNTNLGNYLTNLNGAEASMSQYIAKLVTGKVATFALQAATIALNAALSLGVSLLISAAISAFTEWKNREEEARDAAIEAGEAAKEEAEEAISSVCSSFVKRNFCAVSKSPNMRKIWC